MPVAYPSHSAAGESTIISGDLRFRKLSSCWIDSANAGRSYYKHLRKKTIEVYSFIIPACTPNNASKRSDFTSFKNGNRFQRIPQGIQIYDQMSEMFLGKTSSPDFHGTRNSKKSSQRREKNEPRVIHSQRFRHIRLAIYLQCR